MKILKISLLILVVIVLTAFVTVKLYTPKQEMLESKATEESKVIEETKKAYSYKLADESEKYSYGVSLNPPEYDRYFSSEDFLPIETYLGSKWECIGMWFSGNDNHDAQWVDDSPVREFLSFDKSMDSDIDNAVLIILSLDRDGIIAKSYCYQDRELGYCSIADQYTGYFLPVNKDTLILESRNSFTKMKRIK